MGHPRGKEKKNKYLWRRCFTEVEGPRGKEFSGIRSAVPGGGIWGGKPGKTKLETPGRGRAAEVDTGLLKTGVTQERRGGESLDLPVKKNIGQHRKTR